VFSLANSKVSAAVAVTDMRRARDFYERVLGLVTETDSGDNVAYRCAEGSLVHVFVSPNAGSATATVAGWGVDDIDTAVRELAAQGVVFERYTSGPITTDERGVASFPGGNQVAYFKDPDGNTLSIASVANAPKPALDAYAVATRLPAQDLGRARRWYQEKLGLQPAETRPGGLLYLVGATAFVLFASTGKPSGEHTQMGFDVADVDSVVARLRDRGVEFEEVDVPGLRTVDGIADIDGDYPSKGRGERGGWFRDSEGNLLGVGQRVP
jgi:catechol 2,3-dioxygenase-like lactoylglutathione lyase family enzyme